VTALFTLSRCYGSDTGRGPSLRQDTVDELDGDRSLAFRGCSAFHAFRADIANGEDTRHTRFEEIWLAAAKANVPLPIGANLNRPSRSKKRLRESDTCRAER
jgi:hypothetical protein